MASMLCLLEMSQRRKQLWDEGDPVPHGDFTLEGLKGAVDGALAVVLGHEPLDTDKVLSRLGVLVDSSGLEVTADCMAGQGDLLGLLLELLVVVMSPGGPGLGQSQIDLHRVHKGHVGFLVQRQLGEEHALHGEELGLLVGAEVHEVRVVDHL